MANSEGATSRLKTGGASAKFHGIGQGFATVAASWDRAAQAAGIEVTAPPPASAAAGDAPAPRPKAPDASRQFRGIGQGTGSAAAGWDKAAQASGIDPTPSAPASAGSRPRMIRTGRRGAPAESC
jgi:hypothetical protein